jgi:membrane-bound metal-dependent hydrolase YbcI (DUF457 family)
MPCHDAHTSGGLLAGLAASFMDQNPPEERLLLGSLLTGSAVAASKLPDVLEPAIHSHHRKFFHSFVVLFGAAAAAVWLWHWRPETAEARRWRAVMLGALIGYSSHLGMDAMTPRCLPLV